LTLQNLAAVEYVRSGREIAGAWAWRKIAGTARGG
jgi:hypothetical protein